MGVNVSNGPNVKINIPRKRRNFLSRLAYIFVIDAFHEHQLPVRPLGVGLVLEGSAQLLDGHISVQDSVVACTAEENPTV